MLSRNSLIESMNRIFELNCAEDITVRYLFRQNSTARYFGKHIRLSSSDTYDICLNDEYFDLFRKVHPKDVTDDYVEYKGLLYLTAEYLLSYRCCIFHSVSFLFNGKAWLISGVSGVGKTTQFRNWDRLFSNEITMISGDMPVLDFRGKSVIVHPSFWNGKEGMKSDLSGELGGIVILEQGTANSIERPDIAEAITVMFQQFAVIPINAEEIFQISEMIEKLIQLIPVWKFTNDGSDRSTGMLRSVLLREGQNI